MDLVWQDLFARRVKRMTGSQIRQFFSLTERPEVISFAGGFPGSDFFPQEDIARALAEMVREEGRQPLQYTPTEGNYELRVYLAEKMRREEASCEFNNIVVINGSQQGLDLLCRVLVNPGDPVLVEEPAYIGGMGAIYSCGGSPTGIPTDNEGVIPSVMEKTIQRLIKQGQPPRLFYTVTNFNNPGGYTTSLTRRQAVMELANRYNLIIVEDNPYGELCYDGEVPPSYKSMDEKGRVVYLGSFSKTFIPGIRIGWMCADLPLVEKVILAKQTTDLCSSSLGQRLAYRLSREGYIDRHVKRLVGLYRKKRDAMLESMNRYFPPEISFSKPKGGFFVWVVFPPYYPPSRELLTKALDRGVAFVHGEGFYSGGSGTHCARFSFSQPSLEDIHKGIECLGHLFYEIREETGHKAASG